MKRNLILSICISLFLFNMNSVSAEDSASKSQKKSWMADQNDQTDIYAIPLDDSEEEEKIEEQELQNEQKKLRRKN